MMLMQLFLNMFLKQLLVSTPTTSTQQKGYTP